MSHEFTPQEDTQVVWDAALLAIQNTEEGRRPYLEGQRITTIPPNSREPEQINLHYEYDGAWRDVYRTLGITALGPVSYEYACLYWEEPEENEEVTFGPDHTETLGWLADLANDIRSRKGTK